MYSSINEAGSRLKFSRLISTRCHFAYTYSASWQILEEHVDLGGAGTTGDPTDPADQYDGTANRVSQNYWGVRYIDDYVSKRIVRAPASTGESELARTFDDGTTASNRYVFLTDAQFSVVATADHTGGLIDRVSYSPYGVPEHRQSCSEPVCFSDPQLRVCRCPQAPAPYSVRVFRECPDPGRALPATVRTTTLLDVG